MKRRKQNHKISFHFFAAPFCTPLLLNGLVRKFLVLYATGRSARRTEVGVTTLSERKTKFRITMRSARAKINRFAIGRKFGFHHIDGAIQNKKPILARRRGRETENRQGFSTGFAKKMKPPDPAKAGSCSPNIQAVACEPIFFLFLSKKLKQ